MDHSGLDKIDLRIVRELLEDGRISIQDLSARVGITASPCARRVRQLEDSGVIQGYSANVNEQRLGYKISVFVSVKLAQQVDDRLVTFEEAIGEYPEVVDCWLMTGNRDYLMRIVVEDLTEYEQFLTSRLTKVPGVASIESSIPIRQVKNLTSRVP